MAAKCFPTTPAPPFLQTVEKFACQDLAQKAHTIAPRIEKIACRLLASNFTEDDITDTLCEEARSWKVEVPPALCRAVVKCAWEYTEEKCFPTDPLPPIKPTIEKLACRALADTQNRTVIVQKLCTEVRTKAAGLPESLCDRLVDGVWRAAELKCSLTDVPIMHFIEGLVCKALASSQTEKDVTKKICEEASATFQRLPESFCLEAASKAWQHAKEKCPESELPIVV